jgi:hypothetical protein
MFCIDGLAQPVGATLDVPDRMGIELMQVGKAERIETAALLVSQDRQEAPNPQTRKRKVMSTHTAGSLVSGKGGSDAR